MDRQVASGRFSSLRFFSQLQPPDSPLVFIRRVFLHFDFFLEVSDEVGLGSSSWWPLSPQIVPGRRPIEKLRSVREAGRSLCVCT